MFAIKLSNHQIIKFATGSNLWHKKLWKIIKKVDPNESFRVEIKKGGQNS